MRNPHDHFAIRATAHASRERFIHGNLLLTLTASNLEGHSYRRLLGLPGTVCYFTTILMNGYTVYHDDASLEKSIQALQPTQAPIEHQHKFPAEEETQ
jgi:hypothetical protein